MNDNSPEDKVKYDNVLPFPSLSVSEETLDKLKAEVQVEVVGRLLSAMGTALGVPPKAPESIPASLSSKKEKHDAAARLELLKVLYEYFLTREELKDLVSLPWSKDSVSRLYFEKDHSFLYFSRWGNLHVGGGDRVTCEAAKAIETYELKRVINEILQ